MNAIEGQRQLKPWMHEHNRFNIISTYIPKHKLASPKTYVTEQHVDKEDFQKLSEQCSPYDYVYHPKTKDHNFYYKH